MGNINPNDEVKQGSPGTRGPWPVTLAGEALGTVDQGTAGNDPWVVTESMDYAAGSFENVEVSSMAAVQVVNLANRRAIAIFNNGPNAIFVGFDNTVTTATGFPIAPGGVLSLDLTDAVDVWLIAITADQTSPADTRVIQTGAV